MNEETRIFLNPIPICPVQGESKANHPEVKETLAEMAKPQNEFETIALRDQTECRISAQNISTDLTKLQELQA